MPAPPTGMPLTVESADAVTAGEGSLVNPGTIERAGWHTARTYNEMPLYYWINDAEVGDATAANFRQKVSKSFPATVYIKGMLTSVRSWWAQNGMTVYPLPMTNLA
ncbi:MAG: hypothetical protein H6672_20875 [Anaerolineaceae bacterium]|nr:hypothetical protein [Anaerolineaceae bacterium]